MNKIEEGKPRLSSEQKQRMQKYAVFALMGVIFAGCIWFIFTPSVDEKAKQEQHAGFNADIPMPKEEDIISDKASAYEQEQMKQKQAERMRSLSDFNSLLGETGKNPPVDLALLPDEPVASKTVGGASPSRPAPVQNSVNAYHDINRTLGNFYEKPREDFEKEQLKQELEGMKRQMNETENRKRSMDEQLALMEKSFQMAAKYMPGTTTEPAPAANTSVSGKSAVAPVSQVRKQTVSSLLPTMSDAEFIETFSQTRNTDFLSPMGESGAEIKNTISACIYSDQTVRSGQTIRLRLMDAVRVGGQYIPPGTLLSGTARIQGERLQVTVNSLESTGTILLVNLTVYDLDGQPGIFIPNLQDLDAAKEILAGMGTSAGTSITLSNDAGKQFVADAGRNLIQGVSQYTSKKLREVKVHLKAGHSVYLISTPSNSPKGEN